MTEREEVPAATGTSNTDDDWWSLDDDVMEIDETGSGWCRPSTEHRFFLRRLRSTGGDLSEAGAYGLEGLRDLRKEVQRCGRRAVANELVDAGADRDAVEFLIDAALRAGDRHALRPLTFEQVLRLQPPEEVVEDWLARGEVGLLFGDPGSFKTFVCLDMAAAVSAGQHWHGRATTLCPVVYAVGEGLGHLAPRLGAVLDSRGPEIAENFRFLDDVPNLLSRTDIERVIRWALPLHPGLVVIDTLATGMPGGDENSAKDMGIVMGHVRLLAHVLNAAVLIVHHTTKTSRTVERGSGALLGAVDVSVNVTTKGVRGATVVALEQVKSRNRPLAPQLLLAPVPTASSVAIGRVDDDDGWATEDLDDTGHAGDVTRIRDALQRVDAPLNQSAVEKAAQISPKRLQGIRGYLTEHPECGVRVTQQGRSFMYSLSDLSSSVPPPKGGEGEGR